MVDCRDPGVRAACFLPNDASLAAVEINHVTVFDGDGRAIAGYFSDEGGGVIDPAVFMGGGVASLGTCAVAEVDLPLVACPGEVPSLGVVAVDRPASVSEHGAALGAINVLQIIDYDDLSFVIPDEVGGVTGTFSTPSTAANIAVGTYLVDSEPFRCAGSLSVTVRLVYTSVVDADATEPDLGLGLLDENFEFITIDSTSASEGSLFGGTYGLEMFGAAGVQVTIENTYVLSNLGDDLWISVIADASDGTEFSIDALEIEVTGFEVGTCGQDALLSRICNTRELATEIADELAGPLSLLGDDGFGQWVDGCYGGEPAKVFVLANRVADNCVSSDANAFVNGDFEMQGVGGLLPADWQDVPDTSPVSEATLPQYSIAVTTDDNGPNAAVGVYGFAYSGQRFVSGLYGSFGAEFAHSGTQQLVSGLVVGQSYGLQFFQAVVGQQEFTSTQGSWRVYLDNDLATEMVVAETVTAQTDVLDRNLNWEARNVTFVATSNQHLIHFLPHTTVLLGTGVYEGVRMGLDSVSLIIGTSSCCVETECLAVISANTSVALAPDPNVSLSLTPCEARSRLGVETFRLDGAISGFSTGSTGPGSSPVVGNRVSVVGVYRSVAWRFLRESLQDPGDGSVAAVSVNGFNYFPGVGDAYLSEGFELVTDRGEQYLTEYEFVASGGALVEVVVVRELP